MPREVIVDVHINGDRVRRLISARLSLLEFLRDDLDLTGSKHGCDVGDCGACTVLVDGLPHLACITLAADVCGAHVETIEGAARCGELHPIQAAMHAHVAAQCGYCTPGIVMNLIGLLRENPQPDEQTLRATLGSNICRCTGYTKILAAAREAAAAWTGPRNG